MPRPLRKSAELRPVVRRDRPDEVASLQAELDQAQKRIAELAETLARESRARTELVHLVAHELRTPITVVSGFTRLLQGETAGPLCETQRRFLDECLKACRRLDRFVDDLLEAGIGGAASPLSLSPAPASLAATIEGPLEALGPMLAERGMRVERRFEAGLPQIPFDARRVEQVVTNLLTNAIRYGRPCGVVRVSTARSVAIDGTASVRVAVEDDGRGIAEHDRERVFAPYVRGEAGGAADGLGIGLAICRRIVEAHGGTIAAGASELGGACFAFTLPASTGFGRGD